MDGNSAIKFTRNDRPTVGVEIELQLVDAETYALKSVITDILQTLPPKYGDSIKPELMQCYLEINSKVCHTIAEVGEDLREKIQAVEDAAKKLDTLLFWGATHPFSFWEHQEITPSDRYHSLIEKMQDTARRIVTFGMHVHVGVDSGDKAVMLIDRMMRYLPTLLALSVNSPFWVNRDTGLHSQRSKIMEQLPNAGLPPLMRNFSEYCWVVRHSINTGFINSIREIWWDVRPHPGFGTVEVRICDLPCCLDDALSLAALIQCLICRLSDDIDKGVYQHDIHPIMVKQNKWKACRYGLDAKLVDAITHKPIPARKLAAQMASVLHDYAVELDCSKELNRIYKLVDLPTGADRQRSIFKETGEMPEVVRRMIAENQGNGLNES